MHADQALGLDDAESGRTLREAPWAWKVRNTAGDWFTAQRGSDKDHRQELVPTGEAGALHPAFLFPDLASVTIMRLLIRYFFFCCFCFVLGRYETRPEAIAQASLEHWEILFS